MRFMQGDAWRKDATKRISTQDGTRSTFSVFQSGCGSWQMGHVHSDAKSKKKIGGGGAGCGLGGLAGRSGPRAKMLTALERKASAQKAGARALVKKEEKA